MGRLTLAIATAAAVAAALQSLPTEPSAASGGLLCPTITALDRQPGWPHGATGTAINGRGDIAGFVGSHAFVWRRGQRTMLETSRGRWSMPVAISDRGDVVGYGGKMPRRDDRRQGFLWRAGKMIHLGSLIPAAIDDGGRVLDCAARRARRT